MIWSEQDNQWNDQKRVQLNIKKFCYFGTVKLWIYWKQDNVFYLFDLQAKADHNKIIVYGLIGAVVISALAGLLYLFILKKKSSSKEQHPHPRHSHQTQKKVSKQNSKASKFANKGNSKENCNRSKTKWNTDVKKVSKQIWNDQKYCSKW